MVQILPPKTSLGTTVGQALGGGLAHGMQKGSEVGFQRAMVQNALKGIENLPKGASPVEVTSYLLQATAGLPDQGRIMQALTPYLVGGQRAGQVFGGAPQQAAEQQVQQQSLGGAGAALQSQQAPQAAQGQQQPQFGGYFQRPKTPQEINQFAANYALTFPEDQNAYVRGQQIAQAENENVTRAWNDFEKRAITQNANLQKRPDRIPLYNQILQKYGTLQDPNEIMKKANEEYGHVSNLLDSFGKANVPGLVKGALNKLSPAAAFTAPTLSRMFTMGGDARDKALRNLQPAAKAIMDMGYEPQLRSEIQQRFSLSPTEVEETLRPLTPKNSAALNSIQDAKKIPSFEEREKNLVNFFKNNVNENTSLLALRHRLWNDKGYDWTEIAQAINDAGLKLNPRQQAELTTIAQAPIQSIGDIFRDYGNWIDFLRGAK